LLSADKFHLERAAARHVFQVSANLVFKCPTHFDDPCPQQAEEGQESARKVEAEKAVYRGLMKRRHPNMSSASCACRGHLQVLRRMQCTPQERLSQAQPAPTSSKTQERWVRQLSSAVAWLGRLGFVHADLRGAIILLDANEDIQLLLWRDRQAGRRADGGERAVLQDEW
jgi:hypothetical protein